MKNEDEIIGYSAEDLKLYEVVEGEEKLYEVSGKTWEGDDMDEEFAFFSTIGDYTRADSTVVFLYVAPELEEVLKPYTDDMCLSSVQRIPEKVLYGNVNMREYELGFVTDWYTYYTTGDSVLMMETDTGEVLADNYFAECGCSDSEEAVKAGKEKVLFMRYDFNIVDYVVSALKWVRENSATEISFKCTHGCEEGYESIYIEGTVDKNQLATFNIERERANGHICSRIRVFEMPLTDKAFQNVAELAKENL